jgi:hypothetical protein
MKNEESPINSLWQAHLERMRSLSRTAAPVARPRPRRAEIGAGNDNLMHARSGEWTAAPPGRLGRRLLADIEPYLEFFAIAREA